MLKICGEWSLEEMRREEQRREERGNECMRGEEEREKARENKMRDEIRRGDEERKNNSKRVKICLSVSLHFFLSLNLPVY